MADAAYASGSGPRRGLNRRSFLASVSMAALLPGAGWGREYGGELPWQPSPSPGPAGYDAAVGFLTGPERAFVAAAVDRLIPEDDFPSASSVGVVEFIDFQLAGPFGRGDLFYLHPPFQGGEESQGYQSRAPGWLYRTAIAAIDGAAGERFAGRRFAELDSQDQGALLGDLSNGDVDLGEASGEAFFTTLLQNAIEGYFSDPVYGGNRDMAGWRMIGFPGARYDYRPYVDRHGDRLEFEPVSVAGFALNPVGKEG